MIFGFSGESGSDAGVSNWVLSQLKNCFNIIRALLSFMVGVDYCSQVVSTNRNCVDPLAIDRSFRLAS